jgi:hypothetical protein
VYTHSTTAAAAAADALVLIFVCVVVGHVVLSMLKSHMHAVHCDHVE